MLSLFISSCAANSYITSMKVAALYEQDGKVMVQVVGIDSKNKPTFASFPADTTVNYEVGQEVSLLPINK